jgi:ATP-binding cassette subfamily B protein
LSWGKGLIILFKKLWRLFDRRRRIQTWALLTLNFFASFAEVISIASIVPFLGAIFYPEKLFENKHIQFFAKIFNISSPKELLLPLTLTFIFLVAASGLFRIGLLWAQSRFSHAIGASISLDLYKAILKQSYLERLNSNTSELISIIRNGASNLVGGVILPILGIINSAITLLFIVTGLIVLSPYVAIATLFGFGFIYLFIVSVTKKTLVKEGVLVNQMNAQVLKNLQEGLGGVRDILIDGTQEVYSQIYAKEDGILRRAEANLKIVSGISRPLVESLGIALIALFAYTFAIGPNGFSSAVPIFGVIAFSAQRSLPLMQQLYSSWAIIQATVVTLIDVIKVLERGSPNECHTLNIKELQFLSTIEFESVSFGYKDSPKEVLKSINLSIKKGDRVGIIGPTGGGKTTLIDVLMGLIPPTKGHLLVDGIAVTDSNLRSWQNKIAHVPQAIFLTDKSIAENIAFGVSNDMIDYGRVKKVAKLAQLSATIEQWPNTYATMVGERGVRLSGGQRQRIGIARALYKQSEIIVLDEATSALDGATEFEVMSAVESLGKDLTIVIVAHRLSTLKNCDYILSLKNGSLERWHTISDTGLSH